jgi:hypothetical protein
MNRLIIGDPLSPTTASPLRLVMPGGNVGDVLIINRSPYDLDFNFYANGLYVAVPANSVRRVPVSEAEQTGVQYSVVATDSTYGGPTRVVVECYGQGECLAPFEHGPLPAVTGSASSQFPLVVASLNGDQWYAPSVGGGSYGGSTQPILYVAPASGLYRAHYSFNLLGDNNMPWGVEWHVVQTPGHGGNDYFIASAAYYAVGGVTNTAPWELVQTNNTDFKAFSFPFPYESAPLIIAAQVGDTVDLTFHLPDTAASVQPGIEVWASLERLS